MENLLQQILERDDLPSPPGVAQRLLELYSQDDIEISEMSKVIGADPVLAAKLIDYCNSPILARARRTQTIDQAIVAIGLRAVKMIGLSFSLMQTDPKNQGAFDYGQFWNQSLATAIMARTISGHLRRDKDVAFLTGLVLNIGQLAMAQVFGNQYLEIIDRANEENHSLVQLEMEEWSVDHYELGGYMLDNWKFPTDMANAVKFRGKSDRKHEESVLVLILAEQIAEMLFVQNTRVERINAIKQEVEIKLGIESEDFDTLFDEAVAFWTEYAKLLNFDCSNATTFEQLESRARRSIAELSLGIQTENSRMLEENTQLRTNILIDPLTGLKNRRAYDNEAMAEFERCKRCRSSFVMMVIDIDHFKAINDTYGHAAGDTILVRVAESLVDHVRRYDSVYRIGGEEFVIILADCAADVARSAAERFRKAVEDLEVEIDGQIHRVTVSIGVRCCNTSDASLEQVFDHADKLMYQAKTRGRNQCCFSIPGEDCALLNTTPPLDLTSTLLPRNRSS
jgi:diguanylate cyclase (GGDEF)-like protein